MYLRRVAGCIALGLPLLFASRVSAQFSGQSALPSANSIPASQQIQPFELNNLLKSNSEKPVIFQVGPRIFYSQSHIPGAKFAGPGNQQAGMQLLEASVKDLPRSTFIVIYCGCCPWARCPNMGPAFKRLQDLGFTNVKALFLPNSFGDDWVRQGYATSVN